MPGLAEIQRLVAERDWAGLLDACEELELESAMQLDARLSADARLPPAPSARQLRLATAASASMSSSALFSADELAAAISSAVPAPAAAGELLDRRSSSPTSDAPVVSPTRQVASRAGTVGGAGPAQPQQQLPAEFFASLLVVGAGAAAAEAAAYAAGLIPSAGGDDDGTESAVVATRLEDETREFGQPDDARVPVLGLLAGLLAGGGGGSTEAARHAALRAPAAVRATAEHRRLVAIAEQLHARDGGAALRMLARLRAADTAARRAGGGSGVWSSPLTAVLAGELEAAVRAREAALLERAYTTVRASTAARRLGLSAAGLRAFAATRPGWTLVETSSADGEVILRLERAVATGGRSSGGGMAGTDTDIGEAPAIGGGPGLSQIADLAGYVVHMER
ncbi:hypothetical protein HK405_006902 [Cladochytrium tenue]|nr:hypothetical protein HK405_006902 [Cladochytrium tenue]